ncbi:MAG: alpha-L-arabinofuranosidase C-terminal domain-containing protein [Planctomycetota bacterium]|jgi:alpha-L-arabinofuranosidase
MSEIARITVNADNVLQSVSPYMRGTCIEDVNHEVYGGIYSQMIFGESFQEPPDAPIFEHWETSLGTWKVDKRELVAMSRYGERGIITVRDLDVINGELDFEMFFRTHQTGYAGVMVKVIDPGIDIHSYRSYAILFCPSEKTMRIGSGRGATLDPYVETKFDMPAGKWVKVSVRFAWSSLQVFVRGKMVAEHFGFDEGMRSGSVGFVALDQDIRVRNVTLNDYHETREIPFDIAAPADGISRMWRPIRTGSAQGSFGMDDRNPYHGAHSQTITHAGGEGEIGVENMALNRWGMSFRKGKEYEGLVRVRCDGPTEMFVAFQSADGATTYAEQTLTAPGGGEYEKVEFTLTPNADAPAGRFAIMLRKPGTVTVGYVFCQPGEWGRFEGLPVRKDIGDVMNAQGLTVVRCGGCLVNNPGYLWKDMLAPRDQREPYMGSWYKYFTHGWAMFDKANYAEKMGCIYIPSISTYESPEDLADLVDFINGDETTEWGRRRIEEGHAEPYGWKIIEYGNEEHVGDAYWERFEPGARAIWGKDPSIILVIGDLYYGETPERPDYIEAGERLSSLTIRTQIMDLAMEYDAEVWFDVHISSDTPENVFGLKETAQFFEVVQAINPGAKMKFAIFELNANNHGQRRALANALSIAYFERRADLVRVVVSANSLQPDGQNDHGWDQGLIFFNPRTAWAQPAYYVHQMIGASYHPNLVEADVDEPNRFDLLAEQHKRDVTPELTQFGTADVHGAGGLHGLDVIAVKSDAGDELVLRVVNVSTDPMPATIDITGFAPKEPNARITELIGDPDDANTADHPTNVTPQGTDYLHTFANGQLNYTFAPYSFTVIKLR